MCAIVNAAFKSQSSAIPAFRVRRKPRCSPRSSRVSFNKMIPDRKYRESNVKSHSSRVIDTSSRRFRGDGIPRRQKGHVQRDITICRSVLESRARREESTRKIPVSVRAKRAFLLRLPAMILKFTPPCFQFEAQRIRNHAGFRSPPISGLASG